MAMRLTPSHGLLPPGGSFTCTVSCTTDMCGDYTDILHVQVARLLSMHGNSSAVTVLLHTTSVRRAVMHLPSLVLVPGMFMQNRLDW